MRSARGHTLVVTILLGWAAAGLMAGGSAPGPVSGLANREVAKREARLAEAQRQVALGATLYDKGDYTGAMKAYRAAWDLLVDAPATAALKTAARDGYSRAANAEARKLAHDAQYAEAKDLLGTVLAEDFDPDNAEAKRFRKQLDDPDRFNPALTPEHLRNVSDVNSLLRLANGLVELGDYDGANQQFQAVLRIDKFNSAARQGMERVEKFKTDYFAAARDHTRAAKIAGVNAQWEEIVPVSADVSGLFGGVSAGPGGASREGITTKLRTWIVSSVDLQGATLEETVEFLRIRSRDLDPKHQGISFILRVPPETRSKTVTLTLAQVPLDELLRYVTQMTGTAYRVDEFAVNITSLSEKTTALVSKSWRVPPDFISNSPTGDAAAPTAPIDPFALKSTKAAPTTMQSLGLRRFGAREFLEQRGVPFPEGATATYNPGTNILFVSNTVENLALIDDLVDQAMGATPKLVEIRVRMLEVAEAQMNELGFDWMVGAASVGSNGVFAAGGTIGNGRTANFTSQEFPITGPDHMTPIGTYPVTAGLRSSGALLGAPSIDGLISQAQPIASDSRSPGTFALAGVFTDPQFQVVLRTLSQKKGKDLLAAPSIITKSGQRASIVVAREFIYPTEFNPPQIPTTIGNGRTVVNIGGLPLFGRPSTVPITPTTPTAFTKRDVGVTLEVEPVVAGSTIDLSIAPTFTEFEGFINYGSDIVNASPGGIGGSLVYYTQPNPILQPVFRTNRGSSAVQLYDGATVVMSSVIIEKRQTINDKVPIVGDLPLVGRAFHSTVAQIERKNVIIFVTARLLDPGGNRVNQPSATTAAAP